MQYVTTITTTTLQPFNAFSQDNLGKPASERQTMLYNEARDDGVASDGPYANSVHLTPNT